MSNQSEADELMQRMADRLIQHGYATAALMDDKTHKMKLSLTPKGNALRDSFKELFIVGNKAYRDEVLALFGMFLIAEE